MPYIDDLGKEILSERHVPSNGDTVTYDIGFSLKGIRARNFAEALANVFFDTDARRWFSVIDGEINFLPESRAVIKLPVKRGMKANSITGHFESCLRSKGVIPKFEGLMRKNIKYRSNFGVLVWTFGAGAAVIDQMTDASNRKEAFYSQIMDDILGNLEYKFQQE